MTKPTYIEELEQVITNELLPICKDYFAITKKQESFVLLNNKVKSLLITGKRKQIPAILMKEYYGPK